MTELNASESDGQWSVFAPVLHAQVLNVKHIKLSADALLSDLQANIRGSAQYYEYAEKVCAEIVSLRISSSMVDR